MDGTDEKVYRIYCVNPYVRKQSISFVVVYSTNLFFYVNPASDIHFMNYKKHECHEHQEKNNQEEENFWVEAKEYQRYDDEA